MTICRTSALPYFRLCASYIQDRDYQIREPSEPADNGSATHDLLAPHILGVDVDFGAILEQYPDADRAEVAKLFAFGKSAWRRLSAFFPAPQTEIRLESDLTAGTCDVLGRGWLESVGDLLSVGDWKTGYRYADHAWQLGGYAYSARENFGMPDSGTIKTVTIWLRLGEIEVRDWDDQKLDAFAGLVRAQAKGIGSAFNPGEHCRFCHGRNDCAARDDWLRASHAALVETESTDLAPETLARLYPQAKALRDMLDQYDKALRSTVAEVGELQLPDGRKLVMGEKTYKSVLPREAWPILQSEFSFSDLDMARCLKMSKSEVEKIAAEKAPARGKGKAKVEIMARLDSVGAVVHTKRQSLTVKKGDPK